MLETASCSRFHNLRQSYATLLIQQGVQLRVVMEILGHSSITITADTYAHVLFETQRVPRHSLFRITTL